MNCYVQLSSKIILLGKSDVYKFYPPCRLAYELFFGVCMPDSLFANKEVHSVLQESFYTKAKLSA